LDPVLKVFESSPTPYSYDERIWIEVGILTLLVIPLTTVLAGKEMKEVMKKDFIMSARVLGGNTGHLLRKHIFPHIGSRMTILFGQQFIQVLLIFIHLGFFQLFLGGTILHDIGSKPSISFTQEWSGLLGVNKDAFVAGKHWLFITVLVAFIIVIYAMQFIIQGVKEVQQTKVGVLYKKPKKKKRSKKEVRDHISPDAPENFHLQDPAVLSETGSTIEGSEK
jgi:peptide/nickel transport system permease protein